MKKVMAIALTLMMLFSASALATTASKTTTDLSQVTQVTTTEGAVVENITVTVSEDTEAIAQELTKIYTAVVNEQIAPVAYFPAETQQTIAALVAADTDVTAMEMNEFIAINVTSELTENEEYVETAVAFSFSTQYTPDQQLVALIGIYSGEKDAQSGEYAVEWIVLEAKALENGSVEIIIPADVLEKLAKAETVSLAILNTPVVAE